MFDSQEGSRCGSPSLRSGFAVATALLMLSGCYSHKSPNLPAGNDAYVALRADPVAEPVRLAYTIRPMDLLDITVANEPELSLVGIRVDRSGRISYPVVGTLEVNGLTAEDLAAQIEAGLSPQYLRNAQVAVNVKETTPLRVSVQGQVTQPGMFEVRDSVRLLDAIALARGTTLIADVKEVVILRDIDGQQAGALFDVGAIQRGEMPNPQLSDGDVVVVGLDALNATWRDILTVAPLLAVFRPLYSGSN